MLEHPETDLRELARREQVGHSDVITAKERLAAKKHGLQFIQRVVEVGESAIQTGLIHRRARLSWEQHLRWAETQSTPELLHGITAALYS